MKKYLLMVMSAVLVTLAAGSCKDSEDNPTTSQDGFDKKEMLTNISSNIIIPAYTSFNSAIANLDAAVLAFNAGPDDEKLTAVQQAFQAAYEQWQSVSVFEFGPAEQVALRVNTNTYPTDISQIESNVSTNTYNPDVLANLAAKGLPAMDYLLFGTGTDNKAILVKYTTDSQAASRKKYLATISAEMKTNVATVRDAWNGAYKATFIAADGTDAGSSTGLLVNQLVYDYEILKNYEVGIPAGVQSMGATFPTKVQAYYSKKSVELALLHLQAVQDIYLGKSSQGDASGLDDFLIKAGAKYNNSDPLNDVIKNQFTAAEAKLKTLSDPLSDQIMKDNGAVTAAYTELQKLTVLLKTDMTSSLGILITYGDNDGD